MVLIIQYFVKPILLIKLPFLNTYHYQLYDLCKNAVWVTINRDLNVLILTIFVDDSKPGQIAVTTSICFMKVEYVTITLT